MGNPECPHCGEWAGQTVAGGFTCLSCEFQWSPEAAGAKPVGKKVFLSYGRSDASGLVDKLEKDLKRAEYDTWRDTREIRAGREWEEEIKDGLRESQAMVAVLSRHSVRTAGEPGVDLDSVCLDEIAFARFSVPRIPIVPVMAEQCEPPLSLYRLQHTDFRIWRDDAGYAKALDDLLEGLKAALEGKERQRRDVIGLRPWDFDSILEKKLEDFVGREWLVGELTDWAKNPVEPALAIVGDPGCGKSAIVAQLVHRNPDGRILAYHFCQADFQDTLDPRNFVRSIAAMIAGRLPAYATALADPDVREALHKDNPVNAFEMGILGPLTRIPAPEDGIKVLLIDALDEAFAPSAPEGVGIVGLLADRLERFPHWLKLMATTRDEKSVLDPFRGQGLKTLSAEDPRNRDDLGKYIRMCLAEPDLTAKLKAARMTAEDVTQELLDVAKGNFLYVKEVLTGIGRNQHDLRDLRALPPQLKGLYSKFFKRSFPDATAFEPIGRILDVVVAAEKPLTVWQIGRATGIDPEDDLKDLLDTLSAYLPPLKGHDGLVRYTVYHKSLADWLVEAPKPYRVWAKRGHRRLADSLYADYERGPSSLSLYAIAHLPRHLAAAARAFEQPDRHEYTVRLVQLTSDERFQEIHERRLDDLLALHRHLSLALEVAAENDSPDSVGPATESALALVAMREKRLRPERLFELARNGDLARVEERLDLYRMGDEWRQAVLLTAAWCAPEETSGAARGLVDRVKDRPGPELTDPLPQLLDRVVASFEGIPFELEPLPGHQDEMEARAIVAQLGGMNLEYQPTMLTEGTAGRVELMHPDKLRERMANDAEVVSQSELEAPRLVAFALAQPDPGDEILRDYINIHATNAYEEYRNLALWGILRSVVRHPDDDWVRRYLEVLCASALTGANPEFTECLQTAHRALASAGDPADFVAECGKTADNAAALSSERGQGDSWGAHKRRFAVRAECLSLLFGDRAEAGRLLKESVRIHPGFAGFGGPAFLTLAEAIRIAEADGGDVALNRALAAAHNVQSLSFCARSTSRVKTLMRHWWPRMPLDLPPLIERFVRNPGAAEFAPLHEIGCGYELRSQRRGSIDIPPWMKDARSLFDLSEVYQRSLEEILDLNPEVGGCHDSLAEDAEVLIPDPGFAPLLAAWLSAQVLVDPVLSHEELVTLIQTLLPVAVAKPTALDTILGRLLLAENGVRCLC